jgi:hypothetical protein
MKTKYWVGLLGVSAVFAALSVVALILFATHAELRHAVGHDKPRFDRFAARVESGSYTPETLMRLTNSWFVAQQQDHQVIQMEETVGDLLAGRLLYVGVCGLLAVLFQTWLILSLRNDLRKA